ncbi:MAG: NAD(P)H-dependent oxidoreductase [Chloroflexi bacterium]|nr:NAD(P)H-dependent oxidoreductase [Chloroflexota bacterium]
MTKPRIAIIIGTTRTGRFSDKPARWIHDVAAKRDDLTTEIVDLREFPMPFFDEAASNAWVPSQNEVAQRWQEKIAEFDGYVFVTAEYNHSIPGVLKNALDYAYPEWNRKPAAFLGYGAVGAARGIEHLRTIGVELQMVPIRTAVHIQGGDFLAVWQQGKRIEDFPYLQKNAVDMLDQLAWWAWALKIAREKGPLNAAA